MWWGLSKRALGNHFLCKKGCWRVRTQTANEQTSDQQPGCGRWRSRRSSAGVGMGRTGLCGVRLQIAAAHVEAEAVQTWRSQHGLQWPRRVQKEPVLWNWGKAPVSELGHTGESKSPFLSLPDLGVFLLATTKRLEALSHSLPASAVQYRGL